MPAATLLPIPTKWGTGSMFLGRILTMPLLLMQRWATSSPRDEATENGRIGLGSSRSSVDDPSRATGPVQSCLGYINGAEFSKESFEPDRCKDLQKRRLGHCLQRSGPLP
jgi:hypothetical protein